MISKRYRYRYLISSSREYFHKVLIKAQTAWACPAGLDRNNYKYRRKGPVHPFDILRPPASRTSIAAHARRHV